MSSHHVETWCGDLKHITAVREYSIEVDRVARDEMHAHVLAPARKN